MCFIDLIIVSVRKAKSNKFSLSLSLSMAYSTKLTAGRNVNKRKTDTRFKRGLKGHLSVLHPVGMVKLIIQDIVRGDFWVPINGSRLSGGGAISLLFVFMTDSKQIAGLP